MAEVLSSFVVAILVVVILGCGTGWVGDCLAPYFGYRDPPEKTLAPKNPVSVPDWDRCVASNEMQ